MARIWVLRAVVIRVDGSQFPSSQQQHSLGVPGAWVRASDPAWAQRLSRSTNFASGPLVFAVEGFVHVNVLHDRRTIFDTRKISKISKPLCWDRYLIVMLLGCLMWSTAPGLFMW